MKISIITSYTNPEERMDPWRESVQCYEEFADEVIIMGSNFKEEFAFSDFGPMFDKGFDDSQGDWVIKMDIDTIIHEKDFNNLYSALKTYDNYPAVSLRKFQFFTPNRFHTKSRMGMVLNKKKYSDIKFNGGSDGCDPTVNGVHINEKNVPRINVPFWNYDSMFKTKEVISNDRARFARAWKRTFDNYGDRGGAEPDIAFTAWFKMIENRYKKHIFKAKKTDHPKFIQNKISTLGKEQFGYNLFGLDETMDRSIYNYAEAINERYISEMKLSFDTSYKNANFK